MGISGKERSALLLIVLLLLLVWLLTYIAPPELEVTSPHKNNVADVWWRTNQKQKARQSSAESKAASSGEPRRCFPASAERPCQAKCSDRITATRQTSISHAITLVTGYYKVKSKHPVDDYMSRVENFLLRIWTPTVVFSDNATFSDVKKFRDIIAMRARLMPGRTHTVLQDMESTPLAKEFGPVMRRQEHRDPELFRGHNYQLYLIWLLKTESLLRAVDENLFCSEWFMWVDIGAFRSNDLKFEHWPSLDRLSMVPKSRVLMALVNPFLKGHDRNWLEKPENMDEWLKEGESSIDGDHIVGTYIAFNIRLKAHEHFFRGLWYTYDKLASKDHLIIKDQTVLNALYYVMPELFAFVPCRDDAGIGNWMYLEAWLAEASERPNQEQLTSLLLP
eukprot:scpid62023/ scgid28518/ 